MATPLDIMGLLRPTAMDMEAMVFFQKLLFPFIYIYLNFFIFCVFSFLYLFLILFTFFVFLNSKGI